MDKKEYFLYVKGKAVKVNDGTRKVSPKKRLEV